MYRSCSRCGKIHSTSYKCNVGRVYRETEERQLRNKYAWAKKSVQIRDDAHYLCEVCRDQGIINYADVEVHHIEKLRDRKDLLLEDENLICLCVEHHKQADDGRISQEYLRSLAQSRIKNIRRGIKTYVSAD